MGQFNSRVEQHYTLGGLFEIILDRLKEAGVDPQRVTRRDIAGVDEFHIRGAAVSLELAREAGVSKGASVLDVGCGIGGPARMLADEFGCRVTGIDLTQEFVRTAGLLSQQVGLGDLTEFVQADALQLPFEDGRFDFVWTQHVQMNIEDKRRFYAEISRVLAPNGLFIYYDIFARDNSSLYYPVPWTDDGSISYLVTTVELKEILTSAGFTEVQVKDQTAEGIAFFKKLFAKIEEQGVPAISLPLLMGDRGVEKLKNSLRNLSDNKIMLQSGICKKG